MGFSGENAVGGVIFWMEFFCVVSGTIATYILYLQIRLLFDSMQILVPVALAGSMTGQNQPIGDPDVPRSQDAYASNRHGT
ncbi:hypothetical protein B7486_09900 [cyanobacterium TDX16]|nr:hypothetical protein B7486_09900 [cyanobacterium TDX16]